MVLLIKISWKYDQPSISISIAHNCYFIIYWWKTCFLAKFGPQKMEKWSFLKKIQKMISETIDSVNKIYFLTQIHCWMSGTILWNLILAQPGCVYLILKYEYIWLYNKRCCSIACNPTVSIFYQISFKTILKCKIARIEKSTLTFFLFSRKTNHLFTVFFSFPVTFFYKRYLQRSNL